MRKYTTFAILSARTAEGESRTFRKVAHRAEFQYTPRPGFLYVRSRAISSRCNDNYDEFPAEEIKKAYSTFVGKPVFVNHHNDDHRKARGVIIDAALHEDRNPDGSPDVWAEVLMEVDGRGFPRLAKEIMEGNIDRTSMGTDVEYSLCSFCANKAATPLEYCRHIPALKGQRIRRFTAGSEPEDVLVREICYGLSFFENSLLVEEPADPTAYFLGVDDTGMAVAASNSTTATATTFNGNFTASSNTANSAFVKVASNDRPSTCQHCNHDWHAMRPCKHEGCQCGNVEGLGTPFASKKPMNPWTEKDEAKAEENETEGRDNPEYMWRHAIGETVVPADVDTLRDSTCPICGEQDSYDGETCAVCNFVKPPDELMDPDLTKAKDLRELQDAQEDTAAPGESPDGQPQDFSMTKEEEGEELGEGFSFKEPGAQDVPEEGDPEEVPVDEVDVSVSETEDPNGDHHNGPDSGFSFQPKERETEVSVEVDSPEAEAESEEEKDSDEDDEEDDDRKKKFNPSKAARGHRRIVDPQESEMRTALRLLAEQQVQLDAEKRAISLIASKLDMRPAVAQIRGEATKRIAALRAEADAENPAQPIPSEGSEAPAATTEETLGDLNADSVETPGATSETDVAPDATTSVDSVGEDVPAPEAANQDVTKAVQGTEGPRPTEEVRIETDVKAQDGVNTDTAFPLEGDFATEVKISSGRQFAALRLAKARIAAHVAESDDDLVEGTKIATSDMSDEAIASEISVLEKVVEASAKTAAAAPQRTASRQPTRRATPSMSGGLASAGVGSGGAALGGDEFLFD